MNDPTEQSPARTRARPALAALAAAAATWAGCVTPEPRPPLPLQVVPAFSSVHGLPRSERWWEDFNDPRLTGYVEAGLTGNFTLRAAYERLREARAIARTAGAALSPTLDATAGGALIDGTDTDPRSEIALGLEASYEVDLWGRIRSSVDAERLEADATAEDYQAAAVTLSAEIARAVYQLTVAHSQLVLLQSQLETNRNVLTVLEIRFAIGQSGSADVLRQRQLVEATVEQQIATRAFNEVLEHQVLVLLGLPPQGEMGLDRPEALPAVTGLPEVGLPADLLQRRPDIRAAYLRLESADSSVAAAVKDQYPSLSLGAAITTAAENPSGLFSAWIASLTAQAVAPLIDGGRRRGEVERTVAVRAQRLAEYGAAVLGSFREVEDALSLERHQAERIESLNAQLDLARTTYTELRNQYLNGAADFIDVLVALRNQQDLERNVLSARLMLIEQRIALHRAIAGGFLHEPARDERARAARPDAPSAGETW